MRELLVITASNPLRAYSGIRYICEALVQRGVRVELWANIPIEMLHEVEGWTFPVHSFWGTWYGKLPKFRVIAARLHTIMLGVNKNADILFTDLFHLGEIAAIKKLRPGTKLIHYCTEFFTEEELPEAAGILRRYRKNSSLPDLVIDVDYDRARLRKTWYSLTTDVVVLPNTIPKWAVPPQSPPGGLARLAGGTLPDKLPIVLYTGGCFMHREFEVIIEAIRQLSKPVFFLAFVYGERDAIDHLRKRCGEVLGEERARICESVQRDRLLQSIHEASVGIVYYPPSVTIGNLYAAPTKLFEYIAVGLPVVCSPNPGLRRLIESQGLGLCASDETASALAEALETVLFRSGDREDMRRVALAAFENGLCYEKAAQEAIGRVINVLAGSE